MITKDIVQDRVKEIMKENGMNTNDPMLVIDCSLIYVAGQRDLLIEQRQEIKEAYENDRRD